MKKFAFNHNDYVTVTLTKEGEVYRTQFWSLINEFHERMYMGMQSPFEMGKLEVESSLDG